MKAYVHLWRSIEFMSKITITPVHINIILFRFSVGIGLCTIVSSKQTNESVQNKSEDEAEDSGWKALTFATGIFMLTFALFMSARMGIYQEVIYSKYGKHAKEALYYSHCLPLAGFLLLYKGNQGPSSQMIKII